MADDRIVVGAEVASAVKALDGLAKAGEKTAKDIGKSFDGVTNQIAKGFDYLKASAAAFAAGFTVKKIIEAGLEAEKSLQAIESAFISTGIDAPKKAAEGFAAFATELANSTGIADDEIVQLSSRLQQIGQFSEQGLRTSTQLALDFAAAYKVDLGAAFDAVGKAATGNTTALSKLGVEIKKGKTDAETFANTLSALEGIQGAAARQGQTFGAALNGLVNNIGEMAEAIGLAIIRTPALADLVVKLKDGAFALAETISQNSDVISKWVSTGLVVAGSILRNLPGIISATTVALVGFNLQLIASKVSAFISLAQAIIQGLIGMRAGFLASAASAQVFWGAATLGASVLIGYLTQTAFELGSLGKAFDLLWQRVKQGFLLIYGPIISGFAAMAESVAELTGVGKGVATKIRSLADGMAESFGNATERVKELKSEVSKVQAPNVGGTQSVDLKVGGAGGASSLFSGIKQAADVAKESLDKLKQSLESAKTGLVNIGLTQLEVAKKKFDETDKIISDSLQKRLITESEAADLRNKNAKRYEDERNKLEEDAAKKRAELIKAASANITGFVNNFKELSKGSTGKEITATGAIAIANSMTQGAEGARQAVSGALTAGATALLGPFGQALGPLLDAFTKGPEAVKKMVTEFLGAIPSIIQNIILAIPAFILAIIQQIPVLIDGLLQAIPVLVEEINAALPLIIEALQELMPQVIQAVIDNLPVLISSLVAFSPTIATSFAVALAAQSPFIALQFSTALIAQVPRIIESIATGLRDAIGKITGGLAGGGGGIVGKVTGAVGGIGKKLKFAEGGVIPGGFPADSFGPAFLSSGEGIVPNDTMQRLDSFLRNGGGGGGQTVVKLVVGEQELANVMLNLNRQGFRTT